MADHNYNADLEAVASPRLFEGGYLEDIPDPFPALTAGVPLPSAAHQQQRPTARASGVLEVAQAPSGLFHFAAVGSGYEHDASFPPAVSALFQSQKIVPSGRGRGRGACWRRSRTSGVADGDGMRCHHCIFSRKGDRQGSQLINRGGDDQHVQDDDEETQFEEDETEDEKEEEEEEELEGLAQALRRLHPSRALLDALQRNPRRLLELVGSLGREERLPPAHSADWNWRFQHLIDLPDSQAKHSQLAALASDFTNTAVLYCQVIINELTLPHGDKTILPVDVGGVAGGEKYERHGILFKFARDVPLPNGCFMYGGDAPDDDAAAKAASNELLGLLAYYGAGVPRLHFPLQALVDYKGFRMIAASILPVSRRTLLYGSSDSGLTVHEGDAQLRDLMQQTARRLNLAPHRAGKSGALVYSAGDVEGHLGSDGRYYLLDFGRAQGPPESPLHVPSTVAARRRVFYHLLRPELVRSHPSPLSPDGLTMWSHADPMRPQHNQEISRCTLRLFAEVIPQFSAGSLKEFAARIDLRSTLCLTELVDLAHREGINLRHLGRVRHHLPRELTGTIGHLLLHEMLARFFKCVLRMRLRQYTLKNLQFQRQKLAHSDGPSEPSSPNTLTFDQFCFADDIGTLNRMSTGISDEVYKALSVQFLNLILKRTVGFEDFWAASIVGLQSKFPLSLSPAEPPTLTDAIDYRVLLPRLLALIGLDMSPSATVAFNADPNSFQFVVSDFPTELRAVFKQMNIAEQSQALELLYQAIEHPLSQVRRRLFELAGSKIQRAIARAPSSNTGLLVLGSLLLHQALFAESDDTPATLALLQRAGSVLEEAIKLDPHCSFGGLNASYILSVVLVKTLVDEQMLRNGTFPHKRVSCLLQRAILSSISTQRETLGLYVAHIFALFSLLQSGSCVASRLPIPFINSSSSPSSSTSPSSSFDIDTSSCVRAFTHSGQLWAKIRLRSINNSARRRIQVLATVQLLLDCLFLVPSDDLSAWLVSPEQHAHLAALRIDVYILHLKWVAPNGFSDLARMSSKVLDVRIPAYLALASTADPQLIPTAAHHLQKAEQKGNHRCFVIAALFYHGMLHASSSPSFTPGSDIFLQLLTIVMNTSSGFHLFPDTEIASWIDSLLTIDPSLFWKFVPRSFASPESSFPGHEPFEVSAFSPLTESQNSEYRMAESRSLRWLVLCKQVPRFHDVIREFLADHRQLHLCYHAFSEDQLSGIFALLASDRLTHLSLSKSHGFTGEIFLRDMSRFQSLKHLSLNDISCLPPDVLVGLGATLPASLCSLRLSSTQMPTEFLGALISQRPSVAASLEALDYSNQRGTNDDDLRRTLVLMTRLTSLNLSSCPKMTSKTVSMLAQSLSGSLTRLIIRSNKCIDSSALQDISLHLTKLTNLDLTMCKQLRCDSFSRIDGLSSLQHLSLQGCDRIGPEAALQVCRSLPFLETLNLRSALVEPPSPAAQDIINAAVACLLGHPQRHPLTLLLGGCRQVAALPLIRFLSECCGAGVDRLAGLDLASTSLALPTSSSQQLLKSLSSSLPGSPSRTSSTSSFSSSFPSSSSSSATGQVSDKTRISSLFVKFNSLLSVSLAGLSISDHDLNGLQQHRGLERVILSGCIRLTSGAALIVSQLPQVRLLDLKRTGVNDRGLEVIASQCGMIEELVLEGCAMLSDAACRSIGKLSKLRDLSLKQCSLISAAGIRNLCPQRRSPICRLNLESISPRFGDQGVLHLSRQFGNLQSLNLAALIEITDASLLVLAQSLLELRSLDLSFLGVSQECVQHIIAHAASLRTLFLVKCPKILQSSIDWKASGINVVVKEATHALVAGVKQQAQARNERIRAQVIQDMSLAAGSEVDVRRVVDEKIREGVESRWARSSYSPNNMLKVYCMEKTLPVFQSLMKKMSSQEEQSDS